MQSLRSGVINAKDSYRFSLPPSWKEQKIANIQSGNFWCVRSVCFSWCCCSAHESVQAACRGVTSPGQRRLSQTRAKARLRCAVSWWMLAGPHQLLTLCGLQLLVTPLRRLISKANATLDQIGTPDSVLASVGPFITGKPRSRHVLCSALSSWVSTASFVAQVWVAWMRRRCSQQRRRPLTAAPSMCTLLPCCIQLRTCELAEHSVLAAGMR